MTERPTDGSADETASATQTATAPTTPAPQQAPRREDSGEMRGYAESLAELEHILTELESEAVDIDELAEKVQRASTLIDYCSERLRTTEATIQRILSDAVPQAHGDDGADPLGR